MRNFLFVFNVSEISKDRQKTLLLYGDNLNVIFIKKMALNHPLKNNPIESAIPEIFDTTILPIIVMHTKSMEILWFKRILSHKYLNNYQHSPNYASYTRFQ